MQLKSGEMHTGKRVTGILLTMVGVLFLIGSLLFINTHIKAVLGVDDAPESIRENAGEPGKSMEDALAELTAGMNSTTGEVVSTEGGITIMYSADGGGEYYRTLPTPGGEYRTGDRVLVYYDPDNPQRSAVPDYVYSLPQTMNNMLISITRTVSILFGIIGFIMLAVGILLLRSSRFHRVSQK